MAGGEGKIRGSSAIDKILFAAIILLTLIFIGLGYFVIKGKNKIVETFGTKNNNSMQEDKDSVLMGQVKGVKDDSIVVQYQENNIPVEKEVYLSSATSIVEEHDVEGGDPKKIEKDRIQIDKTVVIKLNNSKNKLDSIAEVIHILPDACENISCQVESP